MAKFLKIEKKDALNTGRVKLNDSIEDASTAKEDAIKALARSLSAEQIAQLAELKSDDTQQQLDNIIIESGTSDAETIQARGNHPLLKDRLNSVDSELADIAINVRALGAKGDEFTDDTIAIQTAINNTPKGGTLYFPSGIYLVDFVLFVTKDIKIVGGENSVIKVKDESTLFHNPQRDNWDKSKKTGFNLYRGYHAVFFVHDVDFTMKNIVIDGNGQNQTDTKNGDEWNYVSPDFGLGDRNYWKYYHGILFLYEHKITPKIEISGSHIHHFSWTCMFIESPLGTPLNGEDIFIENNILENAGQDILTVFRASDITVRNNLFKNPNSHALHLYIQVNNARVKNNDFILDDTFFNFKPNNKESIKSFIVVAHKHYVDNIQDGHNITGNTFKNKSNDYMVDGVTLFKFPSNINISFNHFENTWNCITISAIPTNDTNTISYNQFYYLRNGIYANLSNIGIEEEVNLTKPIKGSYILKNNDSKQITGVLQSTNDLSLESTITSDEIEEVNFLFDNHPINKTNIKDTKKVNIIDQSNKNILEITDYSPTKTAWIKENPEDDWSGRSSASTVTVNRKTITIDDKNIRGVRLTSNRVDERAAALTYIQKFNFEDSFYQMSFYFKSNKPSRYYIAFREGDSTLDIQTIAGLNSTASPLDGAMEHRKYVYEVTKETMEKADNIVFSILSSQPETGDDDADVEIYDFKVLKLNSMIYTE